MKNIFTFIKQMKKIILLIILVLAGEAKQSFAQKQGKAIIDSLIAVLPKEKEDTNKVNAYIKLFGEYIKFGDKDKALVFAQKGLSISSNIKFLKGEAKCLRSIGTVYLYKSDYGKALNYISKALKINEAINDKYGIIDSYQGLGNIYSYQSDYPKALDYYFKSLKIEDSISNELPRGRASRYQLKDFFNSEAEPRGINRQPNKQSTAYLYSTIAGIYREQHDYPKALEYSFKCLKIMETLNDKKGIGVSYCDLGLIYRYKGDYPKALDCFLKYLKFNEELNNKQAMGTAYTNIGCIYSDQLDNLHSLFYFYKSFNTAKLLDNKTGIILSSGNISENYLDIYQNDSLSKGQTLITKEHISHTELRDSALVYLNIGLDVAEKLQEKYWKSFVMSQFGNFYYKQKKYNEAVAYYLKSYSIVDSTHIMREKMWRSRDILSCYKNMKNWEVAYKWFETYIQCKDSIFNETKNKEITAKEMNYEFEKKQDAAKAEQDKKDAMSMAKLNQEKTKSYALYGGLALLLTFGGFMFNRFKVTQKQKNTIEQKEKETQNQKTIVEEKNKEITQSIEYALRIQTAILPPTRIVKQYLENSFILYKPKDIVAGDFYWMETVGITDSKFQISNSTQQSEISNLQSEIILFAACDCTGHGVPGAMVSVVCHNALNRAVREFGLTQPAAILDKTAEIVIENFSKSEEDIKDGMDISLVSLKFESSKSKVAKLEWAGANNPLWIVRSRHSELVSESPDFEMLKQVQNDDYELIETKADKQPIGMNDDSKPFTNHTFTLNAGDTIYLFTDGFADQFGGETGEKKLTRKKFKEVLLSIQNKSMEDQCIALDNFIVDYRKQVEQIDDILVMGVRV